jgi:hypothetical protein
MNQPITELTDAELEITGSGDDDLGNAIGKWLHHQWNHVCAFASDMTNAFGPEFWNTSMYS